MYATRMKGKSHMKMSMLPEREAIVSREVPKRVFPEGLSPPGDVLKVRQKQKTRLFFNTKQTPEDVGTNSEIGKNDSKKSRFHPLLTQKTAFRKTDNGLLLSF